MLNNNSIRKSISYAAVYLLCCTCNMTFANYSWKQKATLPAMARHESAAFTIGAKGYFATGYSGTATHKDLWEWNEASNVWTQKADLPAIERYGSFAFTINGKGYLGTGWTFTNVQLKDFYEYDPVSNAWTQKADFGGVARYDAVGLSNGLKGYVGFGFIPNHNDWWEYDPGSDTWTAKTNFPGTARQSLTGFTIGTDVYVGTGSTSGGTLFKDLWKYTPSTNSWLQMTDFPGVSRYATIGFTINGEGYIGSGGNGAGTYYNDFYKYNPGSNSWTPIASWPAVARLAGDGFSLGANGYAGLGVGAGTTYHNDFWEYSPDTVELTPSQTNVNCFGGHTGEASVVASGGVIPYTYLWSNGETSDAIIGLAAGSYSVTVTDANGTSAMQSFQIAEPASAVAVSISGNLSYCAGGSTTLTANASGGTGTNYDYSWSTGETTQSISALANSYTVIVTDENGCTASTQQTVSANQLPSCTISGSLVICQGGSTQLCAPAGLTSYLWSTGETTDCITTSNGNYAVTVSDQSGCSSTCNETVTVGSGPSCSISGNLSVCQGGTTELCATPGLSSYLWSTGETTQCITVGDGNYSVTVADQSGCSSTCNETVTVSAGPSCAIGGNLTVCQGGSTQLCAPAGLSSYAWSTGETTRCITTGVGNYSVTVSNQSGCSSSCNASVIEGNGTSCSITGSTTICTGGTTQLCASSGAFYVWNTGATTQCITIGVGSYSVTVTDNGGCSSTCSASVTDAGGNCCNGFRTQTQGGWGAACKGNNPGCYMTSHFASAFPAPNYLTVGCSTFTLKLTSAQAVTDFLPSGSTARALTSNVVNPGGTYNNVLAGQLIAATLSVQFDLTDANFSQSGTHLQDLIILSGTFTGMTVGQVLTEANNVLGGCASSYSAAQLNAALTSINENYDNGTVDLGYLGCNGAAARFGTQQPYLISNLETVIYPNPFYEKTTIRLTSMENEKVTVEIYNVAGEKVAILFDEQMTSGEIREVEFNGSEMTDAVYYYRITNGKEVLNGRLILIK
jgi:N-acetylneuraminic acid mutarotase